MTHPNNDFIKRFLGEDKVSPEQQKALLKKQRMENYYKSLEQKNILVEENKKAIDYTTRKIFSNTKPKTLVDLQEAKKAAAQWIEKLTPYGVFFYNKEQDVWMNNFGVIKKTLDELIQMVSSEYEIVSGGSNETQTLQSFFSDSGSKLALFNSSEETVSVYGISYSPTVSTTLLNTVNVGGIPFSAASNEKCFVSDDGEYLVLSSPNNKSVYFFDVNEDALLQTVTEDQPLFGSLIAVDKDFYGMAISSTELNRDPSIYDTRATSWQVSSYIHYYKRNYRSSLTQKFKKVFSNNAHASHKKSGIDTETILAFQPTGFPQATQGAADMQRESAASLDAAVFRFSDLICKGYNYASANLILKQDQINYKSSFLNAYSPLYDRFYEPGWTTDPSSADLGFSTFMQARTSVNNKTNILEGFDPLPTDEQSESIFTMTSLPSIKQFSMTRKLSENVYYDDKSYRSLAENSPILYWKNVPAFGIVGIDAGITFFNTYIKGSFAEKTFIRGLNGLRVLTETSPSVINNIKPMIDEQVLNTKVSINETHTYSVSQILTSQTIKNIRIYRTYNTSEDGTTTFSFQDYKKLEGFTQGSFSPAIDNTGVIKILYNSADAIALENSFFDYTTTSNFNKIRLGVCASKPYLSNPINCPSSEFAYTIPSSILNQSLVNIFVSDNYLFLNFNTNTVIFTIDNSLSYKPLIFKNTINSLNQYKFTYNINGIFFTDKNNIYKYNTVTDQLDLIKVIEN